MHDLDRREFLAWLGALAVSARAAGAAGVPSAPDAEILPAPIQLGAGAVLADRSFVIADDFAWDRRSNAAILVNAPDVTIRNVTLRGASQWMPRWNRYQEPGRNSPGMPSTLSGIRLDLTGRLLVEGVRIEGFPRAAITGSGVLNSVFRDVQIRDCFMGIRIEPYSPNHNVTLERVHVRDTWGPAPGAWPGIKGVPSQLPRGGFTGGTGIALNSVSNATLRDCVVEGEIHGSFKLVAPQNVTATRLRGIGIGVWGSAGADLGPGQLPSRGLVIEDCTFDKGLGQGSAADFGNCVRAVNHVADLRIARCQLRAAGKDGHGISFSGDAHGQIRDCTIEGFNGVRGMSSAYAIRVEPGSSVNDDVESVNRFVQQKRLVLRR